MTTPPPLTLASNSPRRKELLTWAGYAFTMQPSGVEEVHPPGLAGLDLPAYLSQQKALALAHRSVDTLVLAADTVVMLRNEILEKPLTLQEARQMLARLSGQDHTVITGVTLLHQGRMHTFSEATLVRMRTLMTDEIDFYVDEYKPLDKAGAYGVQEWIGLRAVTYIEGCFYNVMGLPVPRFSTELARFLAHEVGRSTPTHY